MLSDHLNFEQLAGWIAWLSREPRGDRRADIRSALLTAHVRGAWIENDVSVDNFMPKFAEARATTNDPETNALIDDLFSGMSLTMTGFF